MFATSRKTFATRVAMNLGKESEYPAVRKLNPSTSFITHGSISLGKAVNPKEKICGVKVNKTIRKHENSAGALKPI